MLNLRGEHTFLYITTLHVNNKPVFQYVNAGQCKNTIRKIQVNLKSEIPNDGLMNQGMLHELRNVLCVHTAYYGDEKKIIFHGPY
jgi:hypothetical protein